MTSDDQQFLDLLASVPQDIARYGSRIADYIEQHTNAIASDIRDAIDNSSWIPDALRPPRMPGGPSSMLFARAPPPPQTLYEKTLAFASRHRTAIAVVVAFTGTTLVLVHRRKKAHARKRRAKKLPNGAKKEIVILACPTFHDVLTRSLALDLERRGYVVYITVSSTEEDSLVHQEAKADLRPLWIDVTSTVPNPGVDVHPNLQPVADLLTRSTSRSSSPSPKVTGAALSGMSLAGLILFPGASGYPSSPLALLHPSTLIDTLNTRLISPLLTLQQFLPLLSNHSTHACPSSVVIAYPSIPSSLHPPRQLPESLTASSLSSLAASLRREIAAAGAPITVSELKLGNFDMGSTPFARSVNGANNPASTSSELTHWHSSQRAAAQRRSLTGSTRPFFRGAPAREFHNAVFDALAPPATFKAFGTFEWTAHMRPSVAYVGSGARLYDIVGNWVPGGLVGWVMGYRRRVDWWEETGVRVAGVDADTPKEGSQTKTLRDWGYASGSGSGTFGEASVWEKLQDSPNVSRHIIAIEFQTLGDDTELRGVTCRSPGSMAAAAGNTIPNDHSCTSSTLSAGPSISSGLIPRLRPQAPPEAGSISCYIRSTKRPHGAVFTVLKPAEVKVHPFRPIKRPARPELKRLQLQHIEPCILYAQFPCQDKCRTLGTCIHYQFCIGVMHCPDGLICSTCADAGLEQAIVAARKCPLHQNPQQYNPIGSLAEDFLATDLQRSACEETLQRSLTCNWDDIPERL